MSEEVISAKEELREFNGEFGRDGVKFENIRYELLKRACRKQEKANLNFKSKSWDWSSMLDHVYRQYCEEIRMGEGIALMRLGWREFIKTL